MATNTAPGFTLRESYSTPVTGSSELPPPPTPAPSAANAFQFISSSIVDGHGVSKRLPARVSLALSFWRRRARDTPHLTRAEPADIGRLTCNKIVAYYLGNGRRRRQGLQ